VSGNVIYVSGFGAPVTTGALTGHCDPGSPVSGPLGTYSVSGNQLIINMDYGTGAFDAIFSRQ